MIAQRYIDHLRSQGIPYMRRPHSRAVAGQEVAQVLGISGWRVAKSVLVEADGKRWMIVLPVAEQVSLGRLASVLHADSLRLLQESELQGLFPDCELGAEPPFGTLYNLPVIIDRRLAMLGAMIIRAGSHEECLAIPVEDYLRVERPRVAAIGVLPEREAESMAESRI